MRPDPIEFETARARRAKRPAAGFVASIHCPHKSAEAISPSPALDEAFAHYSNATPVPPAPQNWQSATRALLTDITVQLESLDSQRRHLTRLLESVEAKASPSH